MSRKIAGVFFPLRKAFLLHGCEAAHSHIISKKRYFPVFMKKSSAMLMVKTLFLPFVDVSGVTNTT